jgi:hypothetical protein
VGDPNTVFNQSGQKQFNLPFACVHGVRRAVITGANGPDLQLVVECATSDHPVGSVTRIDAGPQRMNP